MNAKVVLLVDVIDSRSVSNFALQRDQALQRIAHSEPVIEYQYAITAWDEIQFLIERPTDLPAFFWRLITRFQPLSIRIGIGIGRISTFENPMAQTASTNHAPGPINQIAHGDAFTAARDALEATKDRNKKSSQSTVQAVTKMGNSTLPLSEDAVTALSNSILKPLSLLINEISANQWAVLRAWEEAAGSQTDAAETLGVNSSTISRSLNRANIWLIRETLSSYANVLNELFAQNNAK